MPTVKCDSLVKQPLTDFVQLRHHHYETEIRAAVAISVEIRISSIACCSLDVSLIFGYASTDVCC